MSCKFCSDDKNDDELIQCSRCKGHCHPSCLELPETIVPQVKTYNWECNDCKRCFQCDSIENEEKILFCDRCDRGYHTYCVKPPIKRKPKGDWFCPICVENQKLKELKLTKKTSKNKKKEKNDEEQLEIDYEEEEKTEKKIHDAKKTQAEEKTQDIETESNTKDSTPEKNNSDDRLSVPGRKACSLSKKYSPNKMCPFPGCNGFGNIKPNNTVHSSINHCPMSRDERKRERELLSMKPENEAESPSKKVREKESPQTNKEKENIPERQQPSFSQTPIENIVSKTDLELFEAAAKNNQDRLELDLEMAPRSDGLKSIIFGDTEMDIWYKSQYPSEYSRLPKLYICEFCLSYSKTETIYKRHMAKCSMRNPPGGEIYRKDNMSLFEVDGQKATVYCQNLCLLAKLFLDHKTLWLDVAPFLFYVLTKNDNTGCHIIGYFSKEKASFLNYNLSCILVMPHFMKKGYGKMLIDFSYLLTQVEGKTGSPERPLSDLGLITYRKYWTDKLLQYLMDYDGTQLSIRGISEKLAIHTNDIISTLQYLGMLKYWKGKHLILLKKEIIEEYADREKAKQQSYVDPKCLEWTPKTF